MKRICLIMAAMLFMCSCETADIPASSVAPPEPVVSEPVPESEPESETEPQAEYDPMADEEYLQWQQRPPWEQLFMSEEEYREKVKEFEWLTKLDATPLEQLTHERLDLLFTVPRPIAEELLGVDADRNIGGEKLPYMLMYRESSKPGYLLTRGQAFGLEPDTPLEAVREAMGAKEIRYSNIFYNEHAGYFANRFDGRYNLIAWSGEETAPVYKMLLCFEADALRLPVSGDKSDPYLRLAGKEPADLSVDDFKLLLNTPCNELERIYGIPPRKLPVPENEEDWTLDDEIEYHQFMRFSNKAKLPVDGMIFHYDDLDAALPPRKLEISSTWTKVNGIQMGCTFADIQAQWGFAEIKYSRDAAGYQGNLWRYMEYRRDGLRYEFECSERKWIVPYDRNNPDNLPPDEEWPQTIDRVRISLDNSK